MKKFGAHSRTDRIADVSDAFLSVPNMKSNAHLYELIRCYTEC